jgi:uncharacterized protein YcbK (DUF882 family)
MPAAALPPAALPSVYPVELNRPFKPQLYTLVSVGRDPGYAAHQEHFGKTDGLNIRLKMLLAAVGRYFARPVMVTSGCRSQDSNREAGGARRSLHLACLAADIKVAGVSKLALMRYVVALPGIGGIGTYCANGIVHIDLGPRRSWFYPCRTKTRRRK